MLTCIIPRISFHKKTINAHGRPTSTPEKRPAESKENKFVVDDLHHHYLPWNAYLLYEILNPEYKVSQLFCYVLFQSIAGH